MAVPKYNDSPYKYTDPIRLFKANDPYYWEVDNIPLKQLEENVKWLKDQLKQEETDPDNISVNRADINELRPYASGGDRLVKVKPGRFTARINDASSKTRLQTLTQVLGKALAETDAWESSTLISNSDLLAAVEKFQSTPISNSDFLGMNGLDERAFTWAVRNEDEAGTFAGTTDSALEYTGFTGAGKAGPFPYSQALTWAKSKNDATSKYIVKSSDPLSTTVGFGKLPLAENHFIKYWRGVARTAIVDVPTELSIEIPAFDTSDFDYTDENGDNQSVANVQSRIDLVYIYSKAVDQKSTKIFDGGKVSTITTPTLGIIRGAGIGASFKEGAVATDYSPVISYDSNGNPKLLANPSDAKALTAGFISAEGNDIAVDVKGSFPSPDDLMNIAPLLAEELEDSAIELVGQSILPVAYVFVNSTDTVVEINDVIDIRPLFRTAELSYNERAGLAAAMPQLSLANPAVGKAQLDSEVNKLNSSMINLLGQDVETKIQTAALGYVFGGWNWGPEATLLAKDMGDFAGLNQADLDIPKSNVRKNYGYPGVQSSDGQGSDSLVSIPMFPDWDLANWVNVLDKTDPGNYPHDYIDHYHTRQRTGDKFQFTSLGGKVNNDGSMEGTPSHLDKGAFGGSQDSEVSFYFLKKKIYFDRDSNPWLADYTVDVQFVNCIPLASRGSFTSSKGNHDNPAGVSGWWIEKSWDSFTIYVAFQSKISNGNTAAGDYEDTIIKRTDTEKFSSFLVPVEELIDGSFEDDNSNPHQGFDGNPFMGLCTIPTIMWTMTGVPVSQTQYLHGNLKQTSTVNLKGL